MQALLPPPPRPLPALPSAIPMVGRPMALAPPVDSMGAAQATGAGAALLHWARAAGLLRL